VLDRRCPLRLVGRVHGLSVKGIGILSRSRPTRSDAKATGGYFAVLEATVVRAVALGLGLSASAIVIVSLCAACLTMGLLVDGGGVGVSTRGRAVGCRVGGIWVLVPLPALNRIGPGGPRVAVVDLIKAASRGRGAKFTGGAARRTVDDHAAGTGAPFDTARTWAAPGWLGVAVHAGGVGVRVAVVAQVGVGVAARLVAAAAARVVAAAAACDTTVAAVAVPRGLDCVCLGDQLGCVAAIDTVDLLVARSGAVLSRGAVGDVRLVMAVGRAGRCERARGAVLGGRVGRAEGQRGQGGQRGAVGPAQVARVPARAGGAIARVVLEGAGSGAGGAAGRIAAVRRVRVVVRGGAREAVAARARRAGAVAGVVVV
jgi:hypothetical protein